MYHCLFIKRLCVLKMTIANKCLNETTEVVEDIKCHHSEQETHLQLSVFTGRL